MNFKFPYTLAGFEPGTRRPQHNAKLLLLKNIEKADIQIKEQNHRLYLEL
jgi:hypothetical protein